MPWEQPGITIKIETYWNVNKIVCQQYSDYL